MISDSQQHMIVPNDIGQGRAESLPSHLMISLSSSPVSAGELMLVCSLHFRAHPGGEVVLPVFDHIQHVVVAEGVRQRHLQQPRHAGGQQILDERLHQLDEHGTSAIIRTASRQH